MRRIANRGSFVTKLSPDESREHLRLRLMLEGLAVSEAARRMTTSDFEELGQLLDAIAQAVACDDYFGTA